jgi:GT2 family glycosyltransferase
VAGSAGLDPTPTISVVVVNYNAGPLLNDCAAAVLASNIPLELLVSDSGSTDGSIAGLRERFSTDPRLQILCSDTNIGFACANNVALRRARGKFLLILNPDCIVERETLRRMLEVMAAHPEAGMAGCLLLNPDGTEQAGCRRAVPTPWRTFVRTFRMHKLLPRHPRFQDFVLTKLPLPSEPSPVEAISGAFMFVRRQALEEVGLFDEAYFLHCEDLDWCMRFRQLHWLIIFVPDVDAVHYKGTCSLSHPLRVLWHKHRGMTRFYRKFFRHQYPLLLMWLVDAAVWCRFAKHFLTEIVRSTMTHSGGVVIKALPRKAEGGTTIRINPSSPGHEPKFPSYLKKSRSSEGESSQRPEVA